MATRKYEPDELVELAKDIYQEKIKHLAEPAESGKFVVVDVESGDYEIDENHATAIGRLRERQPNAVTRTGIVGSPAARALKNRQPDGKEVNTPSGKYETGEVVELGKAIYEEKIKLLVEPAENGKFVVIDVESGDYEIGDQIIAASGRLRERRPNAVTYAGRVGYPTTYDLISVRLDDVDWPGR